MGTGILPKEPSTLLVNAARHPIVRQSGLMRTMTPHSHPTLKDLQGLLLLLLWNSHNSCPELTRFSKIEPQPAFSSTPILSPLLMKLQQNSFQQVLGHTKLLPILGPLNLLGPLSLKLLVCLTPTYPPGLIFNIISLNRFSLTTLSQGPSSTPTHQHPIIF